MKSKSANHYPPELCERAVRMTLEQCGEYDSGPDAIRAISSKTVCHYDTLRAWLRRHRTDTHTEADFPSGSGCHRFINPQDELLAFIFRGQSSPLASPYNP